MIRRAGVWLITAGLLSGLGGINFLYEGDVTTGGFMSGVGAALVLAGGYLYTRR